MNTFVVKLRKIHKATGFIKPLYSLYKKRAYTKAYSELFLAVN